MIHTIDNEKFFIQIGNRTMCIPGKALCAAYCGAYSANWIKLLGAPFKEDFTFHYYQNIKRTKEVVNSLPRYTSLLQVIENATANVWTEA